MIYAVRRLKYGYFSDLNEIGPSLNKIVKAKIIVHVFIFIYLSIDYIDSHMLGIDDLIIKNTKKD